MDISKYTDAELVYLTLQGMFGNGDQRKAALGNRYSAVQALINSGSKGTKPEAGTGYNEAQVRSVLKSVLSLSNSDVENIISDIIQKLNQQRRSAESGKK